MRDLEWSTDSSGMILGAGVHDGSLMVFQVTHLHGITIEIRRLSLERVVFVLSRIGEWSVIELRNGAIVSDVFAWRVGAVPETTWQMGDSGWSGLFRNLLSERDARRTAAGIAQQRPSSWLFQIDFAYGGSLAAVCEHIAIRQIDTGPAAKT